MSNRTDFENVAYELLDGEIDCVPDIQACTKYLATKIASALHDAFVAGQEATNIENDRLRAALTVFVDDLENPSHRRIWHLNDAYERSCTALGREPKEIA